MLRRALVLIAAALAVVNAHAADSAADYPNRLIRLVVPYPPGGSTDGPVRLLAAKLSKLAGVPVIVDNRGGAGGSIGAAEVANATPDGYTLLMSSTALPIAAALTKTTSYDALKDFSEIATFAVVPLVLIANPQRVQFNSLPELVAASKADPGKYTYASAGVGSPGHVAAELIKQAFSVNWLHIPHKGTGPALQNVMGGQVELSVVGFSSVVGLIGSGAVKPLAITGNSRLPQLPDVPAVNEFTPGFEFDMWLGIAAPSKTPVAVVSKLGRLIEMSLKDAETQAQLAKAGVLPSYQDSANTNARVLREVNQFTDLRKRTGLSMN